MFCDESWSEVWPGVEVSALYFSEQCEGFGMKAQACRYFDKSCFVLFDGLSCLSVGI